MFLLHSGRKEITDNLSHLEVQVPIPREGEDRVLMEERELVVVQMPMLTLEEAEEEYLSFLHSVLLQIQRPLRLRGVLGLLIPVLEEMVITTSDKFLSYKNL